MANGAWPDAVPTLETARVLLRPPAPSDADALLAISRDPEIARLTHWTPWASLDEVHAFIAHAQATFAERRSIVWAVHHRADDRLVGTCTLHISLSHRLAELGYTIAREYRRQGLATEAARAAVAFAFGPLALNRVEAVCDVANAASVAVMERLGMRREAVYRERMLAAHGEFRDVVCYAVLAREWGMGA